MLRVVADLVPLFDSPYGARVILGGDLNVSRSTSDPKQLARADAVIGALLSLGLVESKTLAPEPPPAPADCACGHGGTCGHIATWGNAELDHLFVSPGLAGQVTAMSVDPTVVGTGLSDHVPLVLDLALSPERTAHTWDEESFAEEIGRRHGPAAREVIDKLVNWADQKERELAATDGVRTRTLTRFPNNGCTSEPQIWFPVDLELAPKGSQPTIALRARGDLVIQFGGMRLPPFDTEAGRNELRLALNEIEGVDIPSWQLSRWPTIPLTALVDPANLGSPGQGPGPHRDREPCGADGQHRRTGGRRMSACRPGRTTVVPESGGVCCSPRPTFRWPPSSTSLAGRSMRPGQLNERPTTSRLRGSGQRDPAGRGPGLRPAAPEDRAPGCRLPGRDRRRLEPRSHVPRRPAGDVAPAVRRRRLLPGLRHVRWP